MSELLELKREIKEVKSMLRQVLPVAHQEHWVGYSVVMQITSWTTGEKLRWASENNLVKYDKKKGYLLQSIPEIFLNK